MATVRRVRCVNCGERNCRSYRNLKEGKPLHAVTFYCSTLLVTIMSSIFEILLLNQLYHSSFRTKNSMIDQVEKVVKNKVSTVDAFQGLGLMLHKDSSK